jgi:hypothetical protein
VALARGKQTGPHGLLCSEEEEDVLEDLVSEGVGIN